MDQRERSQDLDEVLRAALDGRQAKMQTAMPGIIQSFDPATMTCVVAPAVKGRLVDQNDNVSLVALPLLLDCPCQFPSGGGAALTFPVVEGDECLVIFASRSIDSWHQSGGVQAPVEARMHDLSDGFVILGVRSKPRVLSGISTTSTQLRSDDGATVVDLDPASQKVLITAPAGLTINADVQVNGNFAFSGTGAFAGGGAAVARVGDAVSGSAITAGSPKVTSG